MAAENRTTSNNNSKGKKRKFLPYGKPVRKGLYPLRPGVQGFFITCDGGRERQAMNEALNLLESFYEELIHGSDPGGKYRAVPSKPVNKIIKFNDSDSSSDEDESSAEDKDVKEHNEKSKMSIENKKGEGEDDSLQEKDDQAEKHAQESDCTPVKRQCLEKDYKACETTDVVITKNKPIDELIEDELNELGDRNKRHFVSLDSGCNGCIFIQMHKRLGDPSPAAIAQHMITSAASTKKHMSRFILRVLPAEITCYASEEEISKSVRPLIAEYFPANASTPLKFAVLYEARSNTGIDRMTIINAVAKSVPQPHQVDLKNPDKTIIVQIAKAACGEARPSSWRRWRGAAHGGVGRGLEGEFRSRRLLSSLRRAVLGGCSVEFEEGCTWRRSTELMEKMEGSWSWRSWSWSSSWMEGRVLALEEMLVGCKWEEAVHWGRARGGLDRGLFTW